MSKIVEDLLRTGIIKESQVQEMEEFHDFVKEGGFFSGLRDVFDKYKKPMMYSAAGALPGLTIGILGSTVTNKLHQKAYKQNITNSFKESVGPVPDQHKHKAVQAFQQVASIAPTVAGSAPLMKLLVPEVATKGLTSDRMMNLVQLEKNFNVAKANIGSGRQGLPVTSHMAPVISAGTGIMRNIVDESGRAWARHSIEHDLLKASILNDAQHGVADDPRDNFMENSNSSDNNPDQDDNSSGNLSGTPSPTQTPPPTPSKPVQPKQSGGSSKDSDTDNQWENAHKLQKIYYGMKSRGLIKNREFKNLDIMNPAHAKKLTKYVGTREFRDLSKKLNADPTWEAEAKKIFKSKTTKTASAIGELLADEYLIKKAFDLKGALSSLAIAGTVGAGFGAIEEAAHTKVLRNREKRLKDSWEKSKAMLKKMEPKFSNWVNDKESLPKAKEAFTAMKHLAPGLAENPLVASSFISTILGHEGRLDTQIVKTLTDAQKNYSLSHGYESPFASSPFFSGADKGFGTSGGSEIIKTIAKHSVN
jgi:hypothetical protein